MKKYILTTCLTFVLLFNVLYAQTQSDLVAEITATGNRTLTLENDITFDFGDYGETLKSGELSIIGNVQNAFDNPANVFTLTGFTSAFLDVEESATLNLENIKLSETTSTRDNIITNNGTLNIKNSIISDNLNGQGTSVISNTGSLFIDSSLFENNSVALTGNNEHQLGRGGVIRNSGKAFITNSTFRHNGSQHGSAIYNLESGFLEIKDSLFENNFNTYDSGYAYGSIYNKGTLIVRHTEFLNNTMGSGAAIYNEGIATIYDSTFTNNSANGQGGALTNASGATMTVYNSTFDGNNAVSSSAAINNAFGGNLNIIGSTIQNHTVITDVPVDDDRWDRDNGGAIYFYGQQYHWDDNGNYVETIPSGHLYIQDSRFLYNTVSRGGGAIYNAGYATIINTTFEGNKSDLEHGTTEGNAGTGGAFYDYNQTDMPTIIRDSYFISNSAYSAGAIYHPTGHLIIENTTFDNNSAIDKGSAGALQNGGANSYLDITNSTFSNNYAGHGGGIFHQSKNAMNIRGSTFTGNEAESYGGAMYLSTHEIVKGVASTAVKNDTFITNSTFSENAARSGGSIYLLSNLEIKNSMFNNNTVESTGGAIFVGSDNYHSGIATISNSTFIENSAGNGGAISNNGTLTIYDSIFEKNKAGAGSAILSHGNVNIYNSVFKNNISTYSTDYTYTTGTGVIDGNGVINVYNSSFLNNYHISDNTYDYSGAISGRGEVNIIANNGISLFSGNISNGNFASLFVRAHNEINLFAGNNGSIIINDAIGIMYGGNLHINKDNTQGFATNGVIEINDEIKRLGVVNDNNYSVNLYNGTLKFGSATVNYDTNGDGIGNGNVTSHGSIANEVTFNVYGGKVSTANSEIRNTNLGNLNLFSNALYDLDVDLNNAVADIPTATTFNANGNGFLIDTIHLFGDTDKRYTEVIVSDGSIDVGLSEHTVAAYTPMYRYEINDAKLSSDGILGFSRDIETYRGYNPSLYASSIALLSGNFLSVSSDIIKTLASAEKTTDNVIGFTPHFSYQNVKIIDGYEVSSTHYGSMFDVRLSRDFLLSASYMGSFQSYEKTSMFQNAVQLVLFHFFEKENLFVNSAFNISGNGVHAQTMYGKDVFPILSTSIATNIGYHCNLGSKSMLLPSLQLSYVFSKSFDYTSASGIDIRTSALNAFSVVPSIKFEQKIDSTLSIHAFVKGSLNFNTNVAATANNVDLPEMSIGHYIHYGFGVLKSISSDVEVLTEISGYNIARNGIDTTFSIKKAF